MDQPLTVEQIVAKLKELEALGACPACGNDEGWEPQARVFGVPTVIGDGLNPFEGMPCFAVLCKHCGYVRFHSTQVVETR